jgi:hypothetical protein
VSAAMTQRFPFVEVDPMLGSASVLSYAPITLQLGDLKVRAKRWSRLSITFCGMVSGLAASCSTWSFARDCNQRSGV